LKDESGKQPSKSVPITRRGFGRARPKATAATTAPPILGQAPAAEAAKQISSQLSGAYRGPADAGRRAASRYDYFR
jgi:hypothetical protein